MRVFITEVLSDGGWHTSSEICTKVGVQVPPERAIRSYERHLTSEGRRLTASLNDQIRIGRRYQVREGINSMYRDRLIESKGINRKLRLYRLRT